VLRNRSVWNVVVFYVVGLVFMTSLVLGDRITHPDFLQTIFVILTAQFTWLVMGAMLNPFAGLAIIWVLVAVVMLDTQKGQLVITKAGPLAQALFGRQLWPIIGLVVAGLLGVLLQGLNHNWWATISILPIAQVLIFLGLRNWKISSTKSTNA